MKFDVQEVLLPLNFLKLLILASILLLLCGQAAHTYLILKEVQPSLLVEIVAQIR